MLKNKEIIFKYKKVILFYFILFLFLSITTIYSFTNSNASSVDIYVKNNEQFYGTICKGDTGRLIPNFTAEDFAPYRDYASSTDASNPYGVDMSYFYTTYESDTPEVVSIDGNGNYTGLQTGSATLYIRVYPRDYYYSDYPCFTAEVNLDVIYDMTNVSLSTSKVKAYMFPSYYYAKNKPQYDGCVTAIPLISDQYFTEVNGTSISCKSSNSKLKISAYITDNVLYLSQSTKKTGSAKLTVTIYGKVFTIDYKVVKSGISCQSKLLAKGKKFKIKISNYSGKIEWKSTNKKVAIVNSKGVIKGRSIGNCIIIAKVGDQYLGCAVSVTKPKLIKVCDRATYIGTHWKYSQPLRTQNGYYDCSALVWKAYSQKAGVYFGSAGYPGTTVTESAWCRDNGKMLKGGMTYKRFKKMQVNPGDILFKSTNMKDKYGTTYHVEMFTGYLCTDVDSAGKPSYSAMWAARGTFYAWAEGSLLARPMK